MFIHFCRCRPVLTAFFVACAICIGIFCISNATKVTASTLTGHFLFSNLAIYRNLGNDRFEVDPTPVMELAREIIGDDARSNVTFDRTSQCLIVTSTKEKLQRIGMRFDNKYRAIGVELRPANKSETEELVQTARRISANDHKR